MRTFNFLSQKTYHKRPQSERRGLPIAVKSRGSSSGVDVQTFCCKITFDFRFSKIMCLRKHGGNKVGVEAVQIFCGQGEGINFCNYVRTTFMHGLDRNYVTCFFKNITFISIPSLIFGEN